MLRVGMICGIALPESIIWFGLVDASLIISILELKLPRNVGSKLTIS